jgi:hypothetical protein
LNKRCGDDYGQHPRSNAKIRKERAECDDDYGISAMVNEGALTIRYAEFAGKGAVYEVAGDDNGERHRCDQREITQ